MKKVLFFLFFVVNSFLIYSQLEMRSNPYVKGSIILKNNDVLKGFIKLDDSAFRVRYKKNKHKKQKEKIDYREIKKIIVHINPNQDRIFFYKYIDTNKYLKFVELVYESKFDVYLSSINDLSLFYKDVDRSNVDDYLFAPYYVSNSEMKESLLKVRKPLFLIDDKRNNKLHFIHSNRKLRKISKILFNSCLELVEEIENKKFDKNDVIKIVSLYSKCLEYSKN